MLGLDEYPQKARSYRQSGFLHLILIVLFGMIAYSNTFNAPFVFDDIRSIAKNPQIKDFSYFTDIDKAGALASYNYFQSRIVGFFTFALNYRIDGLNVRGYHIFNLAVHLINALLVYLLVILSFRTPALRDSELSPMSGLIALFASLLFVSHPIQTQAVTYIVQRFTSLATMFYLSSLVLYIKSRLSEDRKKSIPLFALAIISAVLAMRTKEIAFTLPLIIVLYELMFLKGTAKKRLLHLIPILLTLLVIPFSILDFHKPIGDLLSESGDITRLQTTMSRWDYLFTQFRVIVTYIRLLVLPINQNLDYDYPVFNSLFNPQVFLSFLFLASILGLGVYLLRFRYYRLVSFGIFWFFITLAVESSVIPIQDVIFEHRVYLPSVGFTVACISFILILARKQSSDMLHTLTSIILLCTLFLSIQSFSRNNTWKSDYSLWSDVLRKSPNKARANLNVGLAYYGQGNLEKAYECYQRAIELKPGYAEAYNNIALLYTKIGNSRESIKYYLLSLKFAPMNHMTHYNLGIAYMDIGEIESARKEFEKAVSLSPDNDEPRRFLAYIDKLK